MNNVIISGSEKRSTKTITVSLSIERVWLGLNEILPWGDMTQEYSRNVGSLKVDSFNFFHLIATSIQLNKQLEEEDSREMS
jgi:hypothetical protein